MPHGPVEIGEPFDRAFRAEDQAAVALERGTGDEEEIKPGSPRELVRHEQLFQDLAVRPFMQRNHHERAIGEIIGERQDDPQVATARAAEIFHPFDDVLLVDGQVLSVSLSQHGQPCDLRDRPLQVDPGCVDGEQAAGLVVEERRDRGGHVRLGCLSVRHREARYAAADGQQRRPSGSRVHSATDDTWVADG